MQKQSDLPAANLPLNNQSQGTGDVHWGALWAVVYALVLYVAVPVVVAVGLLGVASVLWGDVAARHWLNGAVSAQFVYIVLVEFLTVGAIVGFMRARHTSVRAIGLNKPNLGHIGLALLGFGAYFLLYIAAAALASVLVPSLDFEQKQQLGFDAARSTTDLVLTAISLVVLPPLAEEIVFRGFLYSGLRRRFRVWPAALITSLLFGMGHLQFASGEPLLWVAMLDTCVLSLVLCYVRERGGSLWPGIFIHATKNAVAFSALFLFK